MKLARLPLIRKVYSHLRDQLIRGQLRPSQMLRVQDLAAELDVFKTPIHDALAQLVDLLRKYQLSNRFTDSYRKHLDLCKRSITRGFARVTH